MELHLVKRSCQCLHPLCFQRFCQDSLAVRVLLWQDASNTPAKNKIFLPFPAASFSPCRDHTGLQYLREGQRADNNLEHCSDQFCPSLSGLSCKHWTLVMFKQHQNWKHVGTDKPDSVWHQFCPVSGGMPLRLSWVSYQCLPLQSSAAERDGDHPHRSSALTLLHASCCAGPI